MKTKYTQPYVYSMVSKDGHLYYGCRHAKGCRPEELGVTYFSSSKRVAELIRQHGKDYFMYEVEALCANTEDALRKEAELIATIANDPLCLNRFHSRRDGTLVYFGNGGEPLPDWFKKHLSDMHKGKPKPEGFKEKCREVQLASQAQMRIWERGKAALSQSAWAKADQFYQLWKNEGWGHERFCNRMHGGLNIRVFYNMYKMFKYEGWIPSEDPDWLKDFH